MNHDNDRSVRLPDAKQGTSQLSETILQERINSYSRHETPRQPAPNASDDFVSIEIHINKKAVDAMGKSCNDAINFFPNLILQGSQAVKHGIRDTQQEVGKAFADAGRSWDHGLRDVQAGFRDASIGTYKTINRGAEQIQHETVNMARSTEHAAQAGINQVQRDITEAVHLTQNFAQHTSHDVAKAASTHLREWAAALDPDKPHR